jgi:hypothetical protein
LLCRGEALHPRIGIKFPVRCCGDVGKKKAAIRSGSTLNPNTGCRFSRCSRTSRTLCCGWTSARIWSAKWPKSSARTGAHLGPKSLGPDTIRGGGFMHQ